MTTPSPVRPCLRPLRREMALPSSVRGPVDFMALRRLASSWSGEQDMGRDLNGRVRVLGSAGRVNHGDGPASAPRD